MKKLGKLNILFALPLDQILSTISTTVLSTASSIQNSKNFFGDISLADDLNDQGRNCGSFYSIKVFPKRIYSTQQQKKTCL